MVILSTRMASSCGVSYMVFTRTIWYDHEGQYLDQSDFSSSHELQEARESLVPLLVLVACFNRCLPLNLFLALHGKSA